MGKEKVVGQYRPFELPILLIRDLPLPLPKPVSDLRKEVDGASQIFTSAFEANMRV